MPHSQSHSVDLIITDCGTDQTLQASWQPTYKHPFDVVQAILELAIAPAAAVQIFRSTPTVRRTQACQPKVALSLMRSHGAPALALGRVLLDYSRILSSHRLLIGSTSEYSSLHLNSKLRKA